MSSQILIKQPNYQTARKYWNKLKNRLVKEGSQSVTICHRLTDCRRWQELPDRCCRRYSIVANQIERFDRFKRFSYIKAVVLMQGSPIMQTYTANEAKTRFGEFLDRVQREPVRVMRHDRVVGVMVSAEDYEAMRQFYADRLRQTLRETAEGAAASGLTEEKLTELLADES